MQNVGISHVGGHGLNMPAPIGSDAGRFYNLYFVYTGGNGINIERGNFNQFYGLIFGNCRGHGINILDASSGNVITGADIQFSAGYGIRIAYSTGESVPRDNQFEHVWDEDNALGCLKIDNNARHNKVDFNSFSSAAPDVAAGNLNANAWSGRDRNSDDDFRTDGFTNVRLRHLETQDNDASPTLSAGAATGSGGSAVLLHGRDSAGVLRVINGTGVTTGTLATMTFASSYSNAPAVILTPANTETALEWSKFYVPAIGDTDGPTTTTFKIVARAALTNSNTYKFYYWVVGAN